VLCSCSEYDELPVRHNEDRINAELSKEVGPGPCVGRVGLCGRAAVDGEGGLLPVRHNGDRINAELPEAGARPLEGRRSQGGRGCEGGLRARGRPGLLLRRRKAGCMRSRIRQHGGGAKQGVRGPRCGLGPPVTAARAGSLGGRGASPRRGPAAGARAPDPRPPPLCPRPRPPQGALAARVLWARREPQPRATRRPAAGRLRRPARQGARRRQRGAGPGGPTGGRGHLGLDIIGPGVRGRWGGLRRLCAAPCRPVPTLLAPSGIHAAQTGAPLPDEVPASACTPPVPEGTAASQLVQPPPHPCRSPRPRHPPGCAAATVPPGPRAAAHY
jgi:hypothetical protein